MGQYPWTMSFNLAYQNIFDAPPWNLHTQLKYALQFKHNNKNVYIQALDRFLTSKNEFIYECPIWALANTISSHLLPEKLYFVNATMGWMLYNLL